MKFVQKRSGCLNDEKLRKEIQHSMNFTLILNIFLISGFFKFLEYAYLEKIPSQIYSVIPNKAIELEAKINQEAIKNKSDIGPIKSLVKAIYSKKLALPLFFAINIFFGVKTFFYYEKKLNSKKLDLKYTFYSQVLLSDNTNTTNLQ